MSNKYERFYIIYSIWLLVFIFFTNKYYDANELVLINQLDSLSYMAIANSAPNYTSEIIPYHHAQRLFFPYLIGIFANFLGFGVFNSFQFFTFITLFLIIYLHYLIIKRLKTDLFFSIISISLLVLNPYIFRYSISVPTMINDVIFILSLYLFLLSLKFNHNYNLVSIFLGLSSRQNGIFIFIANLINIFFQKKFLFWKERSFIFSILILLVIFFISNHYASKVSIQKFDYKHVYGIFEWFSNSWNFIEFMKWILLPLYSYFPVIIVFFIFRKIKVFQKQDMTDYSILIFLFFSIVGMSILSGPELSGRNIIRLTSLAYPIILVWLSWFTILKKKSYNKSLIVLLIVSLHIWSLHPTYSNISLFGFLRDYLF